MNGLLGQADKAMSDQKYDAAIEGVQETLRWLGLDWDEEVVFQGARVERHSEIADRLLTTKRALADCLSAGA